MSLCSLVATSVTGLRWSYTMNPPWPTSNRIVIFRLRLPHTIEYSEGKITVAPRRVARNQDDCGYRSNVESSGLGTAFP